MTTDSTLFLSELNLISWGIEKKEFIRILPVLLRNLLVEGLLDKERLTDYRYVWSKILQERERLPDLVTIVPRIDNSFYKTARNAIRAGRYEVAIVLLATVIEHRLNIFYREILVEQNNLTNSEITDFLRSNNINAKVGWLLPLLSGNEIYPEYQKLIIKLMELRNQIVHFKAIPIENSQNGENSYEKFLASIENLDYEYLLTYPKNISAVLDKALDDFRSQPEYGDEYKQAKKIAKQITKYLKN